MGFGPLGVKEAVRQSKELMGSYEKDSNDVKQNGGDANAEKTKFIGDTSTSGGTDSKKPKRRRNNKLKMRLGYPLARGPSEKTGDSLLIKCIQYEPPKSGTGLGLSWNENKGQVTEKGTFRGKKYDPGAIVTTGYSNFKLNVTDANSRFSRNQKIQYYVELPIPQEVNDANVVTWGDNTMNIFQLAGVAAAGALQQDFGGTFQQGLDFISKGIELEGIDADTQTAIRNAISGKAIDQLGANVDSAGLISRTTGQILNSNLELLFSGVNLRTFPFSITFTPRYREEMLEVKRIIRQLKMSMAAKAGTMSAGSASGIFLKSPDVFSLRYLHNGKDHPFLNSFKVCALTGMNVNYTNAGTYASYGDGSPVSIRMNLTFKELNPIYSEDYDKFTMDDINSGVGF